MQNISFTSIKSAINEASLEDLDSSVTEVEKMLQQKFKCLGVKSVYYRTSDDQCINKQIVKGRFIIGDQNDLDDPNLEINSNAYNTSEIKLGQSIKLLLICLTILILVHDSVRIYQRFTAEKKIEVNKCWRDYELNKCEDVLNSVIGSSPYLTSVCIKFESCLKSSKLTLISFLNDKIISPFVESYTSIEFNYGFLLECFSSIVLLLTTCVLVKLM